MTSWGTRRRSSRPTSLAGSAPPPKDERDARDAALQRMRDYYDGFCFDGKTALQRLDPQFSGRQEFKSYWYHSGSPTFILS